MTRVPARRKPDDADRALQRHRRVSIETGAQSSGEGVAQGLEQGFIVTFSSEGDRNYYVGSPVVSDAHHVDPAHQSFKDWAGPHLHEPINPSGVVVFDFQVEQG